MNNAELELFKDMLTGAAYDESAWQAVDAEISAVAPGGKSRLRRRLLAALARFLRRRGMILLWRQPFDAARRAEGGDWPLFGYSMIGRLRLDQLQRAVETVLAEGLPGDFVETGVWRGGACMLIKKTLEVHGAHDRTVWLADSFRGLPPPKDAGDGDDLSNVAMLAVSAEQVRSNFARFGLLDERVRLLEGWFADTLPGAPIERIAVLRLDGDLYHSTMDALHALYDRVVPGGFVIVDDYGSWESCRRAVHDFLAARGETPAIEKIDGSGVFWRTRRG